MAGNVETEITLNFWDKLKDLFSNPILFFDKTKSEKGITKALLTYTIILSFISLISFVFSFMFMSLVSGGLGILNMGNGFFTFFMPFVSMVIGLMMTFIYSGLVHALVIAFKGQGKYSDTYKAYTYSMIPYTLLSIVPMIGWLSIIYSFFLMILGISKFHNLSKGKAALACLIPSIAVLGLAIILVVLFYINMQKFY